MDDLHKAFALEFVDDLPPDLGPESPALIALAAAATEADRNPAAVRKAIAGGRQGIAEIEAWFVREFVDDVMACALDRRRLGAIDTFFFEDEKRRHFICERLRAGDLEGALELAPVVAPTEPGAAPTPGEDLAALQWQVLDPLLRALPTRDEALLLQARDRLRGLRHRPSFVQAPLRAAVNAVRKHLGLTLYKRRGAEPVAVAPPVAVRRASPVFGAERIVVANSTTGAATVGIEARKSGAALAFVVGLGDGARSLSVRVAAGVEVELLVVVIGDRGAPVELDLVVSAGTAAATRLPISGTFAASAGLEVIPLPLAVPIVGLTPAPTPAAATAGQPPAVVAAPSVLPVRPPTLGDRAAASMPVGPIRDAFVRMVATGSISEAELYAAGGDGTARKFAVELARLAEEFGISYDSRTEPQGRLWLWIPPVEP